MPQVQTVHQIPAISNVSHFTLGLFSDPSSPYLDEGSMNFPILEIKGRTAKYKNVYNAKYSMNQR